ncbi:MAG: redox-sensing transcriptional repressor Rex [Candidatus Omnitrophica bacterium]|jgi:redox-sensing transcriptional repressor|nr:redox-sensing transcriptional repressor Rex [Candidatus Omnitrophota bacterium]MDD5081170.1 redox-sensing transcriptional repressor Rex [Candidatus Omnitrophota bacterium]MDD5441050.1 redox-sensing transcriptional repressor Rex [Candidatus Omnitrophota bacterium]
MKYGNRSIIRLSQYRNVLKRLYALGFLKVFSSNLSDAVGVTPAQVRKDFSQFGIAGNKKGGYDINDILKKMDGILGKDKVQKVIIAGMGNIGSALIHYKGFEKEGIEIVAGFDADPVKVKETGNVKIYHINKMYDFIRDNNIEVGIIAVPDNAAQAVFDIMVSAGIKGGLNFAPITLKMDQGCIMRNINVGVELETTIYFMNALKKQDELCS